MAITSISIVSASSRPSVFFLALLLFVLVFDCQAGGRSQLINNLKQDKPQTVVAYGTSLTEGGAWVDQLQAVLDARYPGMATVINSGKAGMWSTWGVENLEERVIQKRPDTVFIEFAINDAHVANHVSLAQAKANLETMISRIHTANRRCEIMLMTMNPPVGGNLERRPQIEAYYQMYRDVAKKYKLPLIDHERHWQRLLEQDKTLFDQYLPDGLHPTGEGCRQVILPGMVEALGVLPSS